MWDERYASVDFAYGQAPNDFLTTCVLSTDSPLPRKRALCLAEGEGRNGLLLARKGWEVTGVDLSRVGLDKFERLASEEGLEVSTIQADLAEYDLGESSWDLIVSIWCHVPPPLREALHAQVVRALRPGGALVLEAYNPRQLEYGTGGPPSAAMMMTLEGLREELPGLDFAIAREFDREIHEGTLHNGMSAVVQVLAFKPL